VKILKSSGKAPTAKAALSPVQIVGAGLNQTKLAAANNGMKE
jgi:hypothetical protein